ncbi:15-hydroxyprostaglandin dehydrogenase [NAD(+)]-like [Patiria miniata]|uniref:15-hydroxyprostaglandin dehydrogenase [NAD(+)] n=1 Tax=Patiria miniata TaxID=46514 RepID=A0A914AQJ9_PATMI|nr:15-hydroxyprostaglandin dehydrogenase [NAD(+)]-like [Patiria miniata]
MRVQGKVALITGAAEGFGRAFAEELLKKGAKGIGIADVNHQKGQETTRRFTSQYGSNKAVFLPCDVTSDQQLEDAFKKTREKYGQLDIVCNNAGVGDEKKWRQMININLTAVVHGTYLARKYMSKLNGGSGGVVVNVSSMAGLILGPLCPVYTATKHGVVGFTRTMASFDPAFTADDIRINTLCPSFSDTAIVGKTDAPEFISSNVMKQVTGTIKLLPVSTVAEGFMRLVEEDTHDKVMRVTHERGIDFHPFKKTPPVPSKM